MRSSAGALTVALSYVVMATAWILFSDSLLQLVDPALQTRLQSIKGTAFVLVTHDQSLAARCETQLKLVGGALQ